MSNGRGWKNRVKLQLAQTGIYPFPNDLTAPFEGWSVDVVVVADFSAIVWDGFEIALRGQSAVEVD